MPESTDKKFLPKRLHGVSSFFCISALPRLSVSTLVRTSSTARAHQRADVRARKGGFASILHSITNFDNLKTESSSFIIISKFFMLRSIWSSNAAVKRVRCSVFFRQFRVICVFYNFFIKDAYYYELFAKTKYRVIFTAVLHCSVLRSIKNFEIIINIQTYMFAAHSKHNVRCTYRRRMLL